MVDPGFAILKLQKAHVKVATTHSDVPLQTRTVSVILSMDLRHAKIAG
jgi:hypothetical protein